jgi:hypothetical protein
MPERPPARRGLALLFALALFAATPARAQVSDADELCNPASDPCVVAAAVTVAPDALLDFGDRALRITATGRLNSVGGSLSILCRDLQMDTSSQINLSGTASIAGGNLDVSALATVSIAGTVNVSASAGAGTIAIVASNFSLDAAGRLLLNGASENDGGLIDIAAENMDVGGQIQLNGGSFSAGGFATLATASTFSLAGLLSATGGEGDGGFAEIDSDGLLTVTGTIRLDGANGGFGGEMTLSANGLVPGIPTAHIVMQGTLSSVGGGSSEGGGDGGIIDLTAAGGCQLAGRIQVQSATDGGGGSVTITCGDTDPGEMTMGSDIDARGLGTFGTGGDVSLTNSAGSIAIINRINASGSNEGGGGTIAADASGNITLSERVTATGASGDVSFTALGADDSTILLTQTGSISADGTGTSAQGGAASLEACRTQISFRGGTNQSITALGADGAINLTGVRQIEIAGRMTAGPSGGAIRLTYRDVDPFIESTAFFNPAPLVVVDDSLVGCGTPVATRTPTTTVLVNSPTNTALRITPTQTPTRTLTATPSGPTSTPTARPTPAGPGDKNCNGILEADETRGVITSIFDASFALVCPNVTNDATVADLLQYLVGLAENE